MPTPPSLIGTPNNTASWITGAATKTVTLTWLTGDLIVIIAGSEGNDTLTATNVTGLTFTKTKSNVTASTCGSALFTATATAGGTGVAITISNGSSSGNFWGAIGYVWRSSGGLGACAEQHTATATVSYTPAAGDSAIMWAAFDFAAAAVGTIVPTPTNTRQRSQSATHYTFYVADIPDQTSSGAISYGVSGGGTGPFSILVAEVKGTGGGGGTSPKSQSSGTGATWTWSI